MTRRDEAIRMARATGWDFGWEMTIEQVYEFAALVAAAERDRCAKKCDAISDDFSKRYGDFNGEELGAETCAAAIRGLNDGASEEGQGG